MKITTATTALAATAGVLLGTDGAAAANARFCSSQSGICYSEFNAEGLKNMNVVYRIATPQAAQAAPYDIAFQIVASRNMGWAALSWGGTMVGHPLTVAWPNGNSVTVTSRMANGHTYPNVYSGASYTILPDTGVNGTHWMLSAICHGCSQWSTGSRKSISPYSTSVSLAYAMNSNQGVVTTPSNPASQFTYHDVFNYFRIDYNAARDPNVEVSS